MLKPKDLLDVLYLFILHNLVVLGFAHVKHLSTQGEDTEIVASNYTKSSYRKSFSRITFSQYESALGALACPGVVSIRKFRQA